MEAQGKVNHLPFFQRKEFTMTIIEAINRLDDKKPNNYSELDKIRWLSVLDGTIKSTILDAYKDSEEVTTLPYNEDTSLDTELLVPYPYDDIYIYWLMAQVDNANEEYNKYNNNMMLYNSVLTYFRNDYNREHTAIKTDIRYFN